MFLLLRFASVRERWPTVFVILLFRLVGGAVTFLTMGPATAEIGEIVRFGTRATHTGNQPTVIIRTAAGEQHEIASSRASLQGCQRGDAIRLLRKAHRFEVAPIGCPVQ